MYFYHSDHLGSSSFITDGSAFPTQHLQYLPFGEDFIQQQNTAAYYSPFTFSGKERDFETSLSYFGARYYDAGLSIWLSVDPMSDKYPHQSPFTYCSNNPVMRIDPNGEEDFEVDKKGRITPVKGTENNEGPDRLILLDKKGNQTDQIIEVKKGLLGNIQKGSDVGEFTREDGAKEESPYNFTELAMTDGNEAVQLFNFLADNTDVEWSMSVVKGEKINTMILTSSHSEKHDARGGRIVAANSKVLLYHIHSHLDKAWYGEIGNLYQSSENPGPGDQKLIKLVREISPTAIFEIRFQKENYKVE